MILKPFLMRTRDVCAEADELEVQFGAAGAIEFVREQIARADRDARQRLYRVHDEIARRHPTAIGAA